MASYLRPRRGQKTTAETQAIVLKKGEVFFEIGNSGTPTTGANAKAFGKIKMGDGTSTYSNLGYFIDVDTTAVDWTDSTGTATSAAQGADNYGLLNAITPTATIKSIFGSMKQLLFGLSTQVTSLNNDLSTISTHLSNRLTIPASKWVDTITAVTNLMATKGDKIIALRLSTGHIFMCGMFFRVATPVLVLGTSSSQVFITTGGVSERAFANYGTAIDISNNAISNVTIDYITCE